MDYKFSWGCHQDIALNFEGDHWHNLGPHYILHLPTMLWIAALQTEQGNLFENSPRPENIVPRFNSINLEDVFELARTLPLPEEEFNLKTQLERLSFFTSGLCNFNYRFLLTGKTLDLIKSSRDSHEREIILSLPPTEVKQLKTAYIEFANKDEKMRIIFGNLMDTLVYRLGQFPKIV